MPHNGVFHKDSMSSCSHYSHVYDTGRARYAEEIRRQDLAIENSDSMETIQGKLNREALERFRTNNFRLPDEKFILIGRVGKYLFVAIVLPPYLFFYGLPKWLCMRLFPQLFSVVKTQTLQLGQYMMVGCKWVIDLVSPFMTGAQQRMHKAKQRLVTGLQALQIHAQNLKQYLQRGIQKALHPLTHAASIVSKTAHAAKTKINNAYQSLAEIGKRWNEKAQSLAQGIKHRYDQVAAWVKAPFHWATNKGKELRERAKAFAETLKRTMTHAREAIVARFKVAGEFAQRIAQQIAQPVINWMTPTAQFIAKAFSQGAHWAKEIFGHAKEVVQKFIQAGAAHLNAAWNWIAQTANPIIPWMLFPKLRRLIPQFARTRRTFRYLKEMTQSLFRGASKVKERILKKVKRQIKRLTSFGERAFRKFKQRALTLPKKVTSALSRAIKASRLFLPRLILWIRKLLAWLRVFFLHCMEFVRELATQVAEKIEHERGQV